MEERSLRITGADKTFFNKITNTLTRILIPTRIGINGMLISMKRNSMIKAFETYTADSENYDNEEIEKKYKDEETAVKKQAEIIRNDFFKAVFE